MASQGVRPEGATDVRPFARVDKSAPVRTHFQVERLIAQQPRRKHLGYSVKPAAAGLEPLQNATPYPEQPFPEIVRC